MDATHPRINLDRVTKPSPVEKRRRLFKTSEWDLEEPAALTRIARSPVELALLTGVVIRLFRALVLTTIFLLGMATLHLESFPVREWPWRAPVFAVFETVGEMAFCLL